MPYHIKYEKIWRHGAAVKYYVAFWVFEHIWCHTSCATKCGVLRQLNSHVHTVCWHAVLLKCSLLSK